MGRYVVATTKSWNINNYEELVLKFPDEEFYLITEKEQLTRKFLDEIQPQYVFFPHWSWIIPKEIYENYECVVFHMTDLPFGRGGSPLQNLIVRGIYDTKVSAIKVESGIDTGPVYMKMPIDISYGNVEEILGCVSEIVFKKMIPCFLQKELCASQQEGEVVCFKRRTADESRIPEGISERQIYDYIRMLDGEGYPKAYKDVDDVRMYFSNARLTDEGVCADVKIVRRSE